MRVSIEGSEGWHELLQANAAWVLRNGGIDFSREQNTLGTGMNSGYQAVNLSYLAGAVRVVLVGYTMKPLADGRAHWFGDHPIKTHPAIFSAMLQNFQRLAKRMPPELEIINATPGSALDCFPKRSLESVLSDPEATALPA